MKNTASTLGDLMKDVFDLDPDRFHIAVNLKCIYGQETTLFKAGETTKVLGWAECFFHHYPSHEDAIEDFLHRIKKRERFTSATLNNKA